MRKIETVAVILLTGILLGGCGKSETENNVDTGTVSATAIEVLKDGSIIETITEDFSKDYYDEERLKNMLLSEVSDFNNESAKGDISVEKFENKNGRITVRMKYPSADIYSSYNTDQYNEKALFCGTVAEAYEQGYSMDISMTDIKGEEGIGKEEILGMGEANIFIAKEPMNVKLSGKILYVGENVTAESKNRVYIRMDETGENFGEYYVIFK